MVLHGISWKEKLLYFKQIPPKFPHTSENFVGMNCVKKQEFCVIFFFKLPFFIWRQFEEKYYGKVTLNLLM
jgi:hypothetical protein